MKDVDVAIWTIYIKLEITPPPFYKLSVWYLDFSLIIYCLFIHDQTSPQNHRVPTYYNGVLEEWLNFTIQVCLPIGNWLHGILYDKNSFRLFVMSSRASNKYLVAYIITTCWVPLLWIKLHINLRTRVETTKNVNINMPRDFVNIERCEVRVFCTASSCIEKVRFLFVNEVWVQARSDSMKYYKVKVGKKLHIWALFILVFSIIIFCWFPRPIQNWLRALKYKRRTIEF